MGVRRWFEPQGHRGARGLFPENTLEGFRAALALGVRAFELDVGMTADGVVVVCHDPALHPDIARDETGGWLPARGPLIHDLPHAALRRYDVGRLRPGSAYAAAFPDQRPIDGARVPTLADVLALDPSAWFNIEIKTDPAHPAWTAAPEALAEAALAVAEASGAMFMLESFDWRGPRHLRRLRPDLTLAWLTSAETTRDAGLWWGGPVAADFAGSVPRAVAAEGGGYWAPHHPTLTQALIAEAHGLGLRVLPWTVNEPVAMRRLLAWGVDGLITDRPDLALALPWPAAPIWPGDAG
jgi:glycerophosphoryl diester phosphodiesterase